jgi:phospholipase/lecithinase/hemolysin
MRTLGRFFITTLLLGFAAFSAHAGFTSMYVFGDALSTTTNNTAGSAASPKQYYGKRYSNGRIWVEVLAQRQGIPIANNWSYFDDDSIALLANVNSFPPIPSSALVVVWCNNSDLYDEAVNGDTNTTEWNNAINQGQANELNAIIQLYNKGARTLLMPSAVDLSKVPGFDLTYIPSYLNYIRQECIAYNVAFSNTLNQARATCPGLTIYEPDFFALQNNVLANAASYGLTNALQGGVCIDAIDALGNSVNTNGLGDNYVYWDYLDPTAKFHEIIADTVQQTISPAQINSLTVFGNSAAGTTVNQLAAANVPVGLNGFVEGLTTTNSGGATPWTSVVSFSSTSPVQSISFTAPPLSPIQLPSGNFPGFGTSNGGSSANQTNSLPSGEIQSYRLRFPFNWSWP